MKITDYLLGYSPPIWATTIAGVFLVITLSLSMYLVFEHLYSYKNPEEQKFLIGVVLMVPCYSVESFVSLVNPSISVDCSILRDCYESFAMYCFGRYLVACLGGEERTIEFMRRLGRASSKTPLLGLECEKGTVKHPFPMNYILRPWKLGQWFYQVVKFGIVQYMLIKLLTALLAVIFEAFGVYCEGERTFNFEEEDLFKETSSESEIEIAMLRNILYYLMLIIVVISSAAVIASSSKEQLSSKQCEDLGFTGLALCSDCSTFSEYVKDKELISDCLKCCTEDSDDSTSKMTYSGAILEVCMRKLVFYPEIVGFIEEEKDKFPTVKVQYLFNSPPKLIMLDDEGQHKETIRIDNWKREHILQFLQKKVQPNSASS